MSGFEGGFWPWTIGIVTIVSIALCAVFLWWASHGRPPKEDEVVDHVWDGDLRENNNPLPGWWRWMFYGTIVIGAGYLVLFPGLGFFDGTRGWTQEEKWRREVVEAEARYAPIYSRFASMSIEQLAADPDARRIGERLFLNHCTACHASDAQGGIGYPSLRDSEWQWGGTPEAIETTIRDGRQGTMQAWGEPLGAEAVEQLTQHVLALAGRPADAGSAAKGQELFQTFCFSCHRMNGQGNPAVGGLNLTDDLWRWGGAESSIRETITHGRLGVMPAHGDLLGPDRVRLVAGYVYGLGGGK